MSSSILCYEKELNIDMHVDTRTLYLFLCWNTQCPNSHLVTVLLMLCHISFSMCSSWFPTRGQWSDLGNLCQATKRPHYFVFSPKMTKVGLYKTYRRLPSQTNKCSEDWNPTAKCTLIPVLNFEWERYRNDCHHIVRCISILVSAYDACCLMYVSCDLFISILR